MLKAIIFDFGQTLVDSARGFRTAEKQAQTNLIESLGVTNRDDFMIVYRRLRKEFHDRSDFSRNSLWRELYYFYSQTPDSCLLERWETEYWETVKSRTTIFPETERVLESLGCRYGIALITNTQGQKSTAAHRISLFPDLERFFQVIIVAGEGGTPPKPDPKPFRMCLKQLRIMPHEAVYVGDDWRIDICGALNAGLRAIWLKHHTVHRNWPEVQASVPVITSLDELLDL